MNIVDIILIVLIGAALLRAVLKVRKDRREGRCCGCSRGCRVSAGSGCCETAGGGNRVSGGCGISCGSGREAQL